MIRTNNPTVDAWLGEFGEPPAFEPIAEYDPSGDCLEFLVSNDAYYAKRLDGWVTAYYSERTGEVIGAQIKGVRTSLLPRFPGIRIEIEGDSVSMDVLLRAPAYQEGDPEKQVAYKALIRTAEKSDLRFDLVPC